MSYWGKNTSSHTYQPRLPIDRAGTLGTRERRGLILADFGGMGGRCRRVFAEQSTAKSGKKRRRQQCISISRYLLSMAMVACPRMHVVELLWQCSDWTQGDEVGRGERGAAIHQPEQRQWRRSWCGLT